MGVTCEEAENGQEALVAVGATGHFDLMLLDLNMPVMDGWGFLREIEIVFPFLRKLPDLYVLTSSISPHDVARVRSISFVKDYYVKPLTREQFTWLINCSEQVYS